MKPIDHKRIQRSDLPFKNPKSKIISSNKQHPDQIVGEPIDNHQQDAAQDATGGHDDQDFGGQQLGDGQPAASDFEDGLNFPLPQPQGQGKHQDNGHDGCQGHHRHHGIQHVLDAKDVLQKPVDHLRRTQNLLGFILGQIAALENRSGFFVCGYGDDRADGIDVRIAVEMEAVDIFSLISV